MSTVKQVGLMAAGCQPWNVDVCAASGDRFAYCATLAVYIYQLDRKYNEFKLHSIMSEHKKTITAISWSSRNPDLLASASADNVVVVWSVGEQTVVARLENTRGAPVSIGWCPHDKDVVAFVYGKGPLYLWNHASGQHGAMSMHKEAQGFSVEICQFRWHPKKMGKIAFGHIDGSVSYICPGVKSQKHVFRPESMDNSDDEDPVAALEWDPLSTEYLLIANTHTGVRLVDTETHSVIMNFQLPSVASQVHTLAWINSAPGMFLSGDAHSGVMRLWNVSKSTPIENIRLKKTGFHALHVFSTTPIKDSSLADTRSNLSSTSEALPAISPTSRYALPPAHAVCTFLDGGVGLYDLGKRKWNFLRDQGHIETIFDCKFHPDNPNLLATGSFDGTIKVWDVNTLNADFDLVHSSPGNEGVIYSLSWAPSDLNCIAASTSRQGAFIWDITKGRIIKRFTEHGKSSVYSIAWNHKDSRRVATCGGDGYCVVRQVDGKPVMKYKHPGAVFGCDWSPNNKDMIATGCEDKNVRVFYLATTSDQPLKVFSGHTAKVFHVRWSPLRDGILCSGSDDSSIRVWDYTQDTCITVLNGHTAPVRGLLWSTEIPYLLISGSWDYSIRIWDTRDGACIDTVLDHGADVYGLTCHPVRPFILASCSRDSTVRIWSLTPLVQPLEMNIIAGRPWSEIVTAPEHAMAPGVAPLLTGKASKDLRMQMEKIQGAGRKKSLRWFSKFFMHPGGPDNLWDLVSVVLGLDDSMLPESYSKGIMHMKHLVRYKASQAQELEMARMMNKFGGIGSTSKDDRLNSAAELHIRLGNVQRYCELMVELGNWEKALAVAPAVSLEYWKSLTERMAQYLLGEDSDDTVPYCVASGNAKLLVQFFTQRGQLSDALMAAAAAHAGNINPPTRTKFRNKSVTNGVEDNEDNIKLLYQTSEELADWYFRNGSPALAACCHLAVEDKQKAMAKLLRGHELELAACVGNVLGTVPELTNLATEYLARRCEKIGRWDLAIDLLKTIPDATLPLAKLCARCAASMAEINDLHEKAGLPTMEECLEEADSLKKKDVDSAVMYYLLSTSPELGLELGIRQVKAQMSRPDWVVDDVFETIQLMGCIQTEKLQQHKCSKLRAVLLVLCAYVGALVAIRRRYDSIIPSLFRHTKFLMEREPTDVPLSKSLVMSEMEAWMAYSVISSSYPTTPTRSEAGLSVEEQQTLEVLMTKVGQENSPLGIGPDIVAGSNLPSHSDVHHSYLDGQRIQGPAFFLEDGRSAISISDAMMWAKVNPFSPLGSGVRINPF